MDYQIVIVFIRAVMESEQNLTIEFTLPSYSPCENKNLFNSESEILVLFVCSVMTIVNIVISMM